VPTATVVDEQGRLLCRHCSLADTPVRRMRGLLGRSRLSEDEGLLLRPASSIHTWFMRFPIDAVFLDRDLVVVETRSTLEPWRAARGRGARAVLELPAGACERLAIRRGDRLGLVS
jgi:uncharacterized membrane protein (UPF0127 family)